MAHHAGVAELADATDLGSVGFPVEVQILSPAPKSFEKKPRYSCRGIVLLFIFLCYNKMAKKV